MGNPEVTRLKEMISEIRRGRLAQYNEVAPYLIRLDYAEIMIKDWLKDSIITKFDAVEMLRFEDDYFIKNVNGILAKEKQAIK
jgi:hypothetical protein